MLGSVLRRRKQPFRHVPHSSPHRCLNATVSLNSLQAMFFLFKSLILPLLPLSAVSIRCSASPRSMTRSLTTSESAKSGSLNISAVFPPAALKIRFEGTATGIIPERTCFALVVEALKSLALVPFNSRLDRAEQIESIRFPGVILGLAGPYDSGGMNVRYIVWGLPSNSAHG